MTEALEEIQDKLRAILSKYCPLLTAKVDTPGRYQLYSIKDVVIDGRKRSQVYFAGTNRSEVICGVLLHANVWEPRIHRGAFSGAEEMHKGESVFEHKESGPEFVEGDREDDPRRVQNIQAE